MNVLLEGMTGYEKSGLRKLATAMVCCVCFAASLVGMPKVAYAYASYNASFSIGGETLSGVVDINDLLSYGVTVYVDAGEESLREVGYGPVFLIYDENGTYITQVYRTSVEYSDYLDIRQYFPGDYLTPGKSYTFEFRILEPHANGSHELLYSISTTITVGGSLDVEEPDEGEDSGGGSDNPSGDEGSGSSNEGIDDGSGGVPGSDTSSNENDFWSSGSLDVEEPDEGEDSGGGSDNSSGDEGSGSGSESIDDGSGGISGSDTGLNENELWSGDDAEPLPDEPGNSHDASPEIQTTSLLETDAPMEHKEAAPQQNIMGESLPASDSDATPDAESRPDGGDDATQLSATGASRSGMSGSELLSKGAVFGLATNRGTNETNEATEMEALDLTMTGLPYAMLLLLLILGLSFPVGMLQRIGAFRNSLLKKSRFV